MSEEGKGSIADHLIDKITKYEVEGHKVDRIEMPFSLFEKLHIELGIYSHNTRALPSGLVGSFMGAEIYIKEDEDTE